MDETAPKSQQQSGQQSTIQQQGSQQQTSQQQQQQNQQPTANDQGNDLYHQHQIATTVTNNRLPINNYGGSVQAANTTGSTPNLTNTNTFKLKQRNYGNNRYDPMAATNYQARNAATAAQLQGQWNNGMAAAAAVAAAQNPYGSLPNPFGLPHHYQQQPVDMYAGYFGSPQQTAYGQYGQQTIPPESPKGGHVVYVYGIGQRATQEELLHLFQPFGRVLRVDIIIDFNTGLCKGYAFVAMEQYQEAQIAIQNLNSTSFHGRQLQVRFKT